MIAPTLLPICRDHLDDLTLTRSTSLKTPADPPPGSSRFRRGFENFRTSFMAFTWGFGLMPNPHERASGAAPSHREEKVSEVLLFSSGCCPAAERLRSMPEHGPVVLAATHLVCTQESAVRFRSGPLLTWGFGIRPKPQERPYASPPGYATGRLPFGQTARAILACSSSGAAPSNRDEQNREAGFHTSMFQTAAGAFAL